MIQQNVNLAITQASVGMTSCDPCPKGRFGNETSLKECFNCTMGEYEDDIGQTSCLKCPAGL